MINILIFVLTFTSTSFAVASQQSDEWDALDAQIAKSQEALAKCDVLMRDKRLEPIKSLIGGKSERKPLDQLERYPTPQEKKLLVIYFDLESKCTSYLEEINPSIPNDFLTVLADLRDGKITYADLAVWQNREIEKSLARVEKLKDKNLSCILESPSNLAGVEIQYSFNESSNTLWASRGNGKPQDVKISDTEITYRTGDSDAYQVTSISRNTGRITTVFHHAGGGTLFVVGSCHAATEHKF